MSNTKSCPCSPFSQKETWAPGGRWQLTDVAVGRARMNPIPGGSLSQADTSAQKEGGLLAVGWGGREEGGAHRPGVNYSPTTGEQALWLFRRPDEENCWPFSTEQDYCDHLVQKRPQDTARLHWGAPPALQLSCVAIIPLLPLFSSDPKTESQREGRQEGKKETGKQEEIFPCVAFLQKPTS